MTDANPTNVQTNPPPPSVAMGLKAFHIVFIVVSVASSLGFGVWGIRDYSQSASGVNLALGMGSLALAVVLLVYGRWFLRKLKGMPT
jgi:hypothetical protein